MFTKTLLPDTVRAIKLVSGIPIEVKEFFHKESMRLAEVNNFL